MLSTNGLHDKIFFPLHREMIAVVLRELLIIDETLDSSTLSVTTEAKPIWHFHPDTGERKLLTRVQGHLAGKWRAEERHSTEDEKVAIIEQHSTISCRKRRRYIGKRSLKEEKRDSDLQGSEILPSTMVQSSVERVSGEDVVAAILNQCTETMTNGPADRLAQLFEIETDSLNYHVTAVVPPRKRKVSDLDLTEGENILSTCKNSMTNDNDIVRSCNLFQESENSQRLYRMFPHDLPPLLEAGIETESRLRSMALTICRSLVLTFSDEALRKFMGYKSHTLHRDQCLLPLLTDYLFSTSHALFAWEATRQEVLLSYGRTPTQRDLFIKETLFDACTLESLGGWEWSSLFRQAVHLLEDMSNTSWENWAKTKQGKRALAHHKSVDSSLRVARRRRHSRKGTRYRSPQNTPAVREEDDCKGQRSRSSSVSSHSSVLQHSGTRDTFLTESTLPDHTIVKLKRMPGHCWGALLSNEGGVCVVVRGSIAEEDDGLQRGDVILQAENENGSIAQHGYRQIVDLFKRSNQLTLKIQRVRC